MADHSTGETRYFASATEVATHTIYLLRAKRQSRPFCEGDACSCALGMLRWTWCLGTQSQPRRGYLDISIGRAMSRPGSDRNLPSQPWQPTLGCNLECGFVPRIARYVHAPLVPAAAGCSSALSLCLQNALMSQFQAIQNLESDFGDQLSYQRKEVCQLS